MAPLIGVVVAIVCLAAAFRSGRRRWLVENLPTSKTTGVFIGLVEVKGTAESSGPPLTSWLAPQPCVYYKWKVEEKWSRTTIDSKGRPKRESGWKTVAEEEDWISFYLKDDCGSVLVHPDNAKIEPLTFLDQTCYQGDPLYYGKGPLDAIAHSDHRRRFTEVGIPLHASLYVMGKSRERQDIIAPEIAEDPQAPVFLISTRTEEQVRRGFQGSLIGWGLAGLAALLFSLIVRDNESKRMFNETWPSYAVAAAGYFFASVVAWIWMVYNALIDLRNRVRQAWAQVDVQLKRRHDLIPNLVNVVKGYREHEQSTQTAVAEMRNQLAATPPGVAGPNYNALRTTVIAVAERYPELKANETFAALQKNLIDTEERIALARGYFNEIATHYNTRLEIVPERFVAAIGVMKPQTLMLADGFERAPVSVNLEKQAA